MRTGVGCSPRRHSRGTVSRRARVAPHARTDGVDIYAVQPEDGTQFLWSRRDSITTAAKHGDLSVSEYTAFLTTMGEKVVWPED